LLVYSFHLPTLVGGIVKRRDHLSLSKQYFASYLCFVTYITLFSIIIIYNVAVVVTVLGRAYINELLVYTGDRSSPTVPLSLGTILMSRPTGGDHAHD